MQPQRDIDRAFQDHTSCNDKMADDHNREIGGKIVCPLGSIAFITDRAMIDRLNKRAKKFSFAAIGATTSEAPARCQPKLAGGLLCFVGFTTKDLNLAFCSTGFQHAHLRSLFLLRDAPALWNLRPRNPRRAL